MNPKFIVDVNVGKLAKWLRVLGYDTIFVRNIEDNTLVRLAFDEGRVILTRDTQIARRRLVATGQLRVITIKDDGVMDQMRQVLTALGPDTSLVPFTRCLECNRPLESRTRDDVKDLVPPYVFKTQTQYMQCPSCKRVYWRGTHWQRMASEIEALGQ